MCITVIGFGAVASATAWTLGPVTVLAVGAEILIAPALRWLCRCP